MRRSSARRRRSSGVRGSEDTADGHDGGEELLLAEDVLVCERARLSSNTNAGMERPNGSIAVDQENLETPNWFIQLRNRVHRTE